MSKRKIVLIVILAAVAAYYLVAGISEQRGAASRKLPHMQFPASETTVRFSAALPESAAFPAETSAPIYRHRVNVDTTVAVAERATSFELSALNYAKSGNRRIYRIGENFCSIEEGTGFWTYVFETEAAGVTAPEFLSDEQVTGLTKTFLAEKLGYSASSVPATVTPVMTGGASAELVTAKSVSFCPEINEEPVYSVFRI